MTGLATYKFQGGDVIALTDGAAEFDNSVFPDLDPAIIAGRLAATRETAIRTEFNCFLLRLAGQPLTLVDTGCGTFFGPDCGRLAAHLYDLNIAPEQIGRIIFTHLHRDHVGGAFIDGQLTFPSAEVILHDDEPPFWAGQDAAAAQFLAACPDYRTVRDGEVIAKGVVAWHLPGHTPGHMGLRIGDKLVLVGDILHSAALQLPDPEVSTKFDSHPDIARDTRAKALKTIAERRLIASGGHFLGPDKFLKVLQEGDSYRMTKR